MNQPTQPTEQEQAERLERYLSGLDQGNILDVSDVSVQEKNLFRFSRELKTVTQSVQPSVQFLESLHAERKKRVWAWLLPLPVVGTAVAAVVFFFQYQRPDNQTVTFTNSGVVLTEEIAQFDQLDSDLAIVTEDLEGQINEINFYAADEGVEQL